MRVLHIWSWPSGLVGLAVGLLALAQPAQAQPTQDPGTPPASERPAEVEDPAAPPVTEAELRALADELSREAADAPRDTGAAAAAGAIGPSTASSMNPDISVLLDVAAATYSHESLATGEHDPAEPGFTLQQLELHIGASVDPFFRLDGNIVYSAHGVELEEAFATSLALPLDLQLRAGQFLSRFGRINAQHPHQWHFVDQPLVLGKFFGGDGNRGVGAEVAYLMPLPWFAEAIVSAQSIAGSCCARTYEAVPLTPQNPEDDQHSPSVMWTGAFKQFFALSRDTSLLWGLSAQTGPQAPEGRAVVLASDVYLRWRPLASDRRQSLSLQAEGMWRRREAPASVAGRAYTDWGGYAEVVWGIDALWEAGLRAEGVSGIADDPLDPTWRSVRTRFAAQGTYYPTHFSRLRVQGTVGRPTWLDHTILGAMLTLEVVVGAHGAHTY